MPKRGMEPIRRAALIDATIAEIGDRGSLDVTVGQIARRAGVSSGLAHHYFGSKDDILLAAMHHILRTFVSSVRIRLRSADSPLDRIDAIIEASFAPDNFRAEVIAAWLNFYVLALGADEARRLHRIYARRLRSNLRHAFRRVLAEHGEEEAGRAASLANLTSQLIDGAYLAQGLRDGDPDGAAAAAEVSNAVRGWLAK